MPDNNPSLEGLRRERSRFPHIFGRVTKEILLFLAILIVSALATSLTQRDSIVVYFQAADQPDYVQVYFERNSVYSEKNSVTSRTSDGSKFAMALPMPYADISHFRIDLGDKAGEFIIKKIELKHFPSTTVYWPSDILSHAKPIQMIDKFETKSAGLVVRSTGNDSAFLFQPEEPSFFVRNAQEILGPILAIIVYLIIKTYQKLLSPSIKKRLIFLLLPLIASLSVSALFYPGFMSYDTLHALYGARNGVVDSMWPPMVSYVWRVVDLVSPNPSAMHFFQVFLLLFSASAIIYIFTQRIIYVILFLLIFLSMPVILGTVAVIWKDVLMAAFFLAGIAVVEWLKLKNNRTQVVLLSLLAVFAIFLAICSRHNAITAAVPVLFYLAFIIGAKFTKRRINIYLCAAVLGSVLIGTSFFAKSILDNYSLPGFTKMSSSNQFFFRTVQALDVAGASECVGRSLFGEIAPQLSLAEIERGYDPRHINLSKGLLSAVSDSKGKVDARITRVWLGVARDHPICFWSHEFQITKYLIGANDGPQFIITQPSIDKNVYGYKLAPSSLRDSVVAYIVQESSTTLLRPWFLYLISVLALIYLIYTNALKAGYSVIFLSAIFYFGSLVLFGNAADARLPFYTTAGLLIFTLLAIYELQMRFIARRRSAGSE